MATPPGGGGDVPQAGYYPDPSIPGYIRFWNGNAWVPGTSRPAPKEGEALPGAPRSAAAPQPAPSVPSVEETGPMFLDEAPAASAWQASTSQQTGFGGDRDQRVSWGRPDATDPRAASAGWPSAGGGAGQPAAPADTDAAHPAVLGQAAGAAPDWPAAGGSTDTRSGASADAASAWPAADAQTGAGGPSGDRTPGGAAATGAAGAPAWPAAGSGAEQATAGTGSARGAGSVHDAGAGTPSDGRTPGGAAGSPAWPAPGAGTDGARGATPPGGQASGPAVTGSAAPESSAGADSAAVRGGSADFGGRGPGAASAAGNGVQGSGDTPAATPGGPAAEGAASVPGQGSGPGHPAPWSGTASPRSEANAAPAAPAWPSAGSQPAGPAAASARLGGMPINPATAPQGAALPAAAPQAAAPHAAAPHAAAPQSAAPHAPAPHAPAPWTPQGPSGQVPDSAAPPVVPWKPPVDDVFTSAAREQAAARPAGMGRRLLARVVDGVVFGAAVGAVAYPFVSAALAHIEEKIEAARQSGVTVQVWLVDSTTAVQFGIVLAAFFVLGVVYEVVPTAKWGRTLGKKVCGIQVRDIEAHEPPTFGAALRRWLVYGVLGLLGVGVLNVLWCLFDRPWRQCWHDKAARTFVAR